MKHIWHRALLVVLTAVICVLCAVAPLHSENSSVSQEPSQELQSQAAQSQEVQSQEVQSQGLQLEKAGTPEVYFSHNEKPLLSFGGLSDFIFYAAPDAFDYKLWADWAAAHGMNHLRAYPPFSWRYIEDFAKENGGKSDALLFPYEETSPGSRQFDLTRFNEAYWQRFRAQCEYLQSKGIMIHLLMMNGWQLLPEPKNWGGHFFNPDNNINDFTQVLKDNRIGFYQSVSNRQTGLVEAQTAWFQKIVEETADLDNVYYDLVHEIAENYQDWTKAKAWINAMASAVRARFSELQPERSIILGMDTGGLEPRQRDWIFGQPYFDVLIYGKSHQVDQARSWRIKYQKPYIPQESWDEDGNKYGFREPKSRVHMRKYLWKFMMAKCQQMDTYVKSMIEKPLPGFPHNYDPNGWNPLEDDAIALREFWNQLKDYPNLWFDGKVKSGPGKQRYVLSSAQEGVVYLSSETGKENVTYDAQSLQLQDLALQDGTYKAEITKPDKGTTSSLSVSVSNRSLTLDLPAFEDDLAVHIFKEGNSVSQTLDNNSSINYQEQIGLFGLKGWLSIVAIALAAILGIRMLV